MVFRIPSLSTAITIAFLAYVCNSLWTLVKLYVPPTCEVSSSKECLKSRLEIHSGLILGFIYDKSPEFRNPRFLGHLNLPSVNEDSETDFSIPISSHLKKNGTDLYFGVFAAPGDKYSEITEKEWRKVIADKETSFTQIPLALQAIPQAHTFNLLQGNQKEEPTVANDRTFSHIRSSITVSVMNELVRLPSNNIPLELYYFLRRSPLAKNVYLPILYIDELNLRIRDLRIVNKTDVKTNVKILYRPIGIGKLRMSYQFTSALSSMKGLGFSDKDTDEVKGMFTDTNAVLLSVTFFVAAIHLLFDFLAFRNDISFWRSKKSMKGLSTSTVLWRAFSQFIIFLFLLSENTSLLVLIPSGIAAIIEVWKITIAFKISITMSGIKFHSEDTNADEKLTQSYDGDAMRYLSYLLCPLVLGGAVYSLLYTPHKSWWSWTIQSTVNGVYAFDFLFMLPQLFVNYKLKSVAHLPWRAFMYKAFNTFIDDLFAFIITMPTSHRVACFRDDAVFLIYLYQRFLYPVDSNRLDTSVTMDDDLTIATNKKEK